VAGKVYHGFLADFFGENTAISASSSRLPGACRLQRAGIIASMIADSC
jgi:hypothetical protein